MNMIYILYLEKFFYADYPSQDPTKMRVLWGLNFGMEIRQLS